MTSLFAATFLLNHNFYGKGLGIIGFLGLDAYHHKEVALQQMVTPIES